MGIFMITAMVTFIGIITFKPMYLWRKRILSSIFDLFFSLIAFIVARLLNDDDKTAKDDNNNLYTSFSKALYNMMIWHNVQQVKYFKLDALFDWTSK